VTSRGLTSIARSFGRLARSASFWSALGVVSATIIMVNVNVLAARFYQRWDFTERQAFTLSDATLRIVSALDAPIEITVFLSRQDRLLVDVRQLLSAYQAETRELAVRHVDPEQDLVEFSALQARYGIVAGKTEHGKVLTDASLVIARGENHWFVTLDDLVSYDAEGNVEPRLEQALTEGIAQVTRGAARVACFTVGHEEVSSDDMAAHGLAELRARLEKSNFEVKRVDLASANANANLLSPCELTIVAGPERVLAERATKALTEHLHEGGNLLVLANPSVGDDGQLRPSGISPVAHAGGIVLGDNFVIERDPALRLPQGQGEAFLAQPMEHAITEGLTRGKGNVDFRLLVIGGQSLGTTDGSKAKPLLLTSKESFAITDIRAAEGRAGELEPKDPNASGPYYVAMASQLGKKSDSQRGARLVVVGSASLAWSRNWRDPALLANRLFVENAVAWLTSVPALVSVPKQQSHPAGLSLTEDSLGEVLRYVLLYMPGTAVGLGFVVVWRRRKYSSKPKRVDAKNREQTP
jgi:hypothetical protein